MLMCPHSILMKQYVGFLISQPKRNPIVLFCVLKQWNINIGAFTVSAFSKMKSAQRSASQPKTQEHTRAHSFWTSFFITSNGVWPQTKPSFIPANSAFQASLSQLWSFTRALMYHISLCFSCMSVSGVQGSKGEIKQKLFKVWQGLESQNSWTAVPAAILLLGPRSNKGVVCYKLKKKKIHERGLLWVLLTL